MLIRLLRDRLGPYRRILAVMVVLQIVQTAATLALPTINARIIDNGILEHNEGYIRSAGVVMLGFSLVQVAFAIGAVYLGAKVAMSFGRDMRSVMFHKVTDFSAREVGSFGAPSLITRITNDVQQVQLFVVMACTMAVVAPITLVFGLFAALRQDVGLSVDTAIQRSRSRRSSSGSLVANMVPAFRLMQDRIDQINRVLREQITGIRVVRAFVREPEEKARFAVANSELTTTSLRAGRLDVGDVPNRQLDDQRVERRCALVRRGPDPKRSHAGRISGGLLDLSDPDPDVRRHGDVHDFHDPPSGRFGRADPGSHRHRLDACAARRTLRSITSSGAEIEFRSVGFRYPAADHAVLSNISFTTSPARPRLLSAVLGRERRRCSSSFRGCLTSPRVRF